MTKEDRKRQRGRDRGGDTANENDTIDSSLSCVSDAETWISEPMVKTLEKALNMGWRRIRPSRACWCRTPETPGLMVDVGQNGNSKLAMLLLWGMDGWL